MQLVEITQVRFLFTFRGGQCKGTDGSFRNLAQDLCAFAVLFLSTSQELLGVAHAILNKISETLMDHRLPVVSQFIAEQPEQDLDLRYPAMPRRLQLFCPTNKRVCMFPQHFEVWKVIGKRHRTSMW